MSHQVEAAIKLTFSGMPEAEAVEWEVRMGDHSLPSFSDPLTYPGCKDVDPSYAFCDEDGIITPEAQQAHTDLIEQEIGTGVDLHHIKTGHAPQVRQHGLTAQMLHKIVEANS